MQDRHICVTVEAVPRAAPGANDVLVVRKLHPKAAHVRVDSALVRGFMLGRVEPQLLDELFTADSATLAKHEVV